MGVRILSGLASGVAAAALMALPASAQGNGAQDDADSGRDAELYCVYDVLSQSGDLYDIANAFVDPDASEADIDAADEVLSGAVGECRDVYAWDDATAELAASVGIHGSVVDVLTTGLSMDGVSEEAIEAIFGVLETLDDSQIDAFSDPAWLVDAKFNKRMNRTLIVAGLPEDEEVLKDSMLVMESSVLAAQAIIKWMDADGAGVTDAAANGSSKRKSNKSKRDTSMKLAATGTGFYVAGDGYLVTNAHVVDGCKRMTLKGGAQLEVLDVEKDQDLALLKAAAAGPPLMVRDGRGVRLAEDLLVAGFPLGGILSSGINVTVGTVSALAGLGDDERRFQFTAPVQPGNSGGPVLDMSGNVIGVVVSKLDAMSVQQEVGDIPQNVNFGISLPGLKAFLDVNNVGYGKRASVAKMDKVDLAEMARDSTVLLECYR